MNIQRLSLFSLVFFFSITIPSVSCSQNLTQEETVEYIDKKLDISDPVYSSFKIGDNGESVLKWVNRGIYTEYRFNIREIEINFKVKPDGDNYLELTCIPGTNNCLQSTKRILTAQTGDDVTFDYFTKLTIESIAGFDNITSLKNAFKYLKIISVENNNNNNSNKDPFLY